VADISDIEAAQAVKVVGSNASGVEQTPVQSTANGALHVNTRDAAGTEILVATSTLQTTGNTSLSGINTKIPSGLTVKAASTPAVATDQALVVAISPNTSITASNPSVSLTGSSVPTQATMVGGTDGTNLRAVRVSSTGVVSVDGSATTQPISAASLPLPTGAATEATISTLNTKIPSNLTVTSTRLLIDGSGVTQPVSGTVTANAGTNLNTSLLALDSTVAKDSSLTTVNSNLGTLNTSVNTLLKPASTLAAVTTLGSITSALPSGANSIGQVTANAGTNLNTSLLALETTQVTNNTRLGDVVETAPASDTASSGLNGRLQRIAQRLSSLISIFNPITTPPGSADSGIVVRPIVQEYATFSAVATQVALANNKSLLAIQNTGTAIIKIRQIWLINDRTTSTTGVAGIFEVLRIASFTGGTVITAVRHDTSEVLPAGISLATGSTVASETDLLRQGVWSTDEWGPGTLDVEANDHAIQNSTPFWERVEGGTSLAIRPGQGLHVKFATNSTAGAFNVRFVFTVE